MACIIFCKHAMSSERLWSVPYDLSMSILQIRHNIMRFFISSLSHISIPPTILSSVGFVIPTKCYFVGISNKQLLAFFNRFYLQYKWMRDFNQRCPSRLAYLERSWIKTRGLCFLPFQIQLNLYAIIKTIRSLSTWYQCLLYAYWFIFCWPMMRRNSRSKSRAV